MIVRILAILAVAAWLTGPAQAQSGPEQTGEQDNAELARMRYQLAESYKARGMYREAVTEYLRAYELLPRPSLLFNAAQAYWLGGDREKALDYYGRYLADEPDGPGAPVAREQFYRAAEESWTQGEQQKALARYQRYLQLAPDGPFAGAARERFFAVAERDWERGNEKQALAAYERYLELAPAGPSADAARGRYVDAGRQREQAGDSSAARTYYQRYLELAPDGSRAAEASARIEAMDAAKAAAEAAAREREARSRAIPAPVARIEQPATTASSRSRGAVTAMAWSGVVHAAIDYKARGAAAVAGVGLGMGERVEVRAAAVLGPTFGAYLGGVAYLYAGTFRPVVGLGLPLFFSNGVRVAARGSVGLEWAATERVSACIELAAERYLNAEIDREDMVLVPIVGIRARR